MTNDPTVNKVIEAIVKRSKAGMKKYGTTIRDNPKPTVEWIVEAQEELADAIIYLERLKEDLT